MKFKEFQKLTKEQQRKLFEQYKKEWLATHNS
ncbi:hypothetical protein C12CBH8_15000 [Solibaculum mannosilyticum]|uniref:Uncharacterized protein n=1 Tax=Solibaculum mannosilyticum TaxID=2780922 RepID=A0A7I8D208_9FIRM|nr:hypothetical protein C12CBH8_15000 [Solibaculum mannosilyticum]